VPTGLIEHHRDVLVFADLGAEAIEEQLHRLGVHIRQDQREGIVGAGLNGCENVGEREALVGQPPRPLAAFPPDMAGAALLTDPGFILEEQPYALFRPTAD
jgi:hypothetical protein